MLNLKPSASLGSFFKQGETKLVASKLAQEVGFKIPHTLITSKKRSAAKVPQAKSLCQQNYFHRYSDFF
jgi:hypothetical protein